MAKKKVQTEEAKDNKGVEVVNAGSLKAEVDGVLVISNIDEIAKINSSLGVKILAAKLEKSEEDKLMVALEVNCNDRINNLTKEFEGELNKMFADALVQDNLDSLEKMRESIISLIDLDVRINATQKDGYRAKIKEAVGVAGFDLWFALKMEEFKNVEDSDSFEELKAEIGVAINNNIYLFDRKVEYMDKLNALADELWDSLFGEDDFDLFGDGDFSDVWGELCVFMDKGADALRNRLELLYHSNEESDIEWKKVNWKKAMVFYRSFAKAAKTLGFKKPERISFAIKSEGKKVDRSVAGGQYHKKREDINKKKEALKKKRINLMGENGGTRVLASDVIGK